MFPALWSLLTPLVHHIPGSQLITEPLEVLDTVSDYLDFATFSRIWTGINQISAPSSPGSVSVHSSSASTEDGWQSGPQFALGLHSMSTLTRISLVPDADNAQFQLDRDHLLAFPSTLKFLRLKCVGAMASFYSADAVDSYLQNPNDPTHPIIQMNTWTENSSDTKSMILSSGVASGDFSRLWPSLQSLHLTETCEEYPKMAAPMLTLFATTLEEVCMSKVDWNVAAPFLPPNCLTLRLSSTYPKPERLLFALPTTLSKLSVDVDPLTVQEVADFPRSLKTLQISCFSEEMLSFLPYSLTSFGADFTFVSTDTLQRLPATITHLTIFGSEVPAISSLPRSLNTVSYRHPLARIDVSHTSQFPKRLRWIEIHRNALILHHPNPNTNAVGFTLIRRRWSDTKRPIFHPPHETYSLLHTPISLNISSSVFSTDLADRFTRIRTR